MNSKFKEGDKVSLQLEGKTYYGKVYIIDIIGDGYRYDVMCSEPKKILVKHIDEADLKKA